MENRNSSGDENEVLAVTRQRLLRQDLERQIQEMEARIEEGRPLLKVQQEKDKARRSKC